MSEFEKRIKFSSYPRPRVSGEAKAGLEFYVVDIEILKEIIQEAKKEFPVKISLEHLNRLSGLEKKILLEWTIKYRKKWFGEEWLSTWLSPDCNEYNGQ